MNEEEMKEFYTWKGEVTSKLDGLNGKIDVLNGTLIQHVEDDRVNFASLGESINDVKLQITKIIAWGILAMNQGQGVYQEGSKARLDLAVLDKVGSMVCDADLTLQIIDPAGAVTTKSTSDGTLEVAEGCFQSVT